MPRQVFRFDPPARFVSGTVGQPGDRTFFLQASDGGRVVSVALEKGQVALLAERLEELLEEARRRGVEVPPGRGQDDVGPLETPVEEEFRVGSVGLAWDGERERVVLEMLAVAEDEEAAAVEPFDEVTEGPDALRVVLDAPTVRAFVRRAQRVVAAGRPPCTLCGLPLDPDGHICPRHNGYRR